MAQSINQSITLQLVLLLLAVHLHSCDISQSVVCNDLSLLIDTTYLTIIFHLSANNSLSRSTFLMSASTCYPTSDISFLSLLAFHVFYLSFSRKNCPIYVFVLPLKKHFDLNQ